MGGRRIVWEHPARRYQLFSRVLDFSRDLSLQKRHEKPDG
jgi:hypothetical protein